MKRKIFVLGLVVFALLLIDFAIIHISDTPKDSFIFKKLEAYSYRGRWDQIDAGGYVCFVCCKDTTGKCTHENQPPDYICYPVHRECN